MHNNTNLILTLILILRTPRNLRVHSHPTRIWYNLTYYLPRKREKEAFGNSGIIFVIIAIGLFGFGGVSKTKRLVKVQCYSYPPRFYKQYVFQQMHVMIRGLSGKYSILSISRTGRVALIVVHVFLLFVHVVLSLFMYS